VSYESAQSNADGLYFGYVSTDLVGTTRSAVPTIPRLEALCGRMLVATSQAVAPAVTASLDTGRTRRWG
jgi:hypothetical protein